MPDIDAEVGIDSGRTTVAVLSDGEMITSPTFLRRAERELRSRSSSTEPATHLGHMCAAVAAGHTLVACPIAPS
ncbi:hypothetical protein [Rhodococcus sp. HNM0569]|uniref:hypothetical protein n=1 Tax=Rhodococcus sp. HNM0569 TaxID=2716340 RepID=UPI00197F5160|nr:hypothetical protein [Rhodococcus sp. HNM0569]